MGTRYEHLQPEDRVTLASLRQQGWSLRAIARLQGRSPSTISRELRRNACHGSYASAPAQRLCDPGGVYQRAELLEAIRYSGQGLAQGVCKQAHQEKRERVEHAPFYWIKPPAGLTDWHWPSGGFFISA